MKKLIACLLALGLAVFPVGTVAASDKKDVPVKEAPVPASFSWIYADLRTGVEVVGQGKGYGFGDFFSNVGSFSKTGKTYIEAETEISNYVRVGYVEPVKGANNNANVANGKTGTGANNNGVNVVKVTDVDAALSFARAYLEGRASESAGRAESFAGIGVETIVISVGNAEAVGLADGYIYSWSQAKQAN